VFVSGEPALIGVQQDAGVSCNLAGLSRFEPARQLSPRLEPAFRRLCFRWAALPKSAHAGAKKTLAEIYNAENKDHADKAARAFAADYGAKWPKVAAKITDDLDVLLAFYDFPAGHWVHLRTTNPIEASPIRPLTVRVAAHTEQAK
jgi:hypothetical protein